MMGGLIHVVMFLGAIVAFTAWAVAGLCAINVAGLAARGQKLTAYWELGRWRFDALETRLGPAVLPFLARYKRAFIVFFATIGAMLVLALTNFFFKPA